MCVGIISKGGLFLSVYFKVEPNSESRGFINLYGLE